jgi:transglutaminase-like putative cysteine protease
MVICFGGIEDNAVIELDYEVVTPGGVLPWMDADLRLHDDYPTVERVVTVTVPANTLLRHKVDRVASGMSSPVKKESPGGGVTYRWTFRDLDGAPGEAQSPPWQQRTGRLRFSTCEDSMSWTSTMVKRVESAARPGEKIKSFAGDAVEEETDPAERVRKIAKKLHDSFNFINSWKATRALACRDASEILHSNYGNRLESAALLAASLRSLGIDAAVEVGVDGTLWEEQVPTDSAFSGVVVVANLAEGPMYVHPQRGVFRNPGSWGRHWLLGIDESGQLRKTYVEARGEGEPSELRIAGKITVDGKGEATGELRMQLTGLYYDPASLETGGAQKSLVKGIAGRLVSGFEVTGHSITTLSDETLRATVNLGTKEALEQLGGQYVVRFGDGPVFLADVPMPLNRSYRRTDVALDGRFRESVDVTIELPDGWAPGILPASLPPMSGAWGTVSQTVDADGKTIRLRREIAVMTETVDRGGFGLLRRAVNALRTPKSVLLTFGADSASECEARD